MAKRAAPATRDAALARQPKFQGSNHVIISHAGYEVDTSGSIWRIPHPSRSIPLD